MEIKVSPLTSNDRNQWEKLYYGYADFYKMPMNIEILDTIWFWIFDENSKFYCIIAKNNSGQAVGLMHFRAMPSPIRGATVGFLDDLYVNQEYRGHGVVDALFKALHESAKANNWPFVRWITAESNYRGRGVYDKIAEKTEWATYQMPVA